MNLVSNLVLVPCDPSPPLREILATPLLNTSPVSIAFSFWTAVLWLLKKKILFC